MRYLNRLSDLLFILSRGANDGDEPLWEPGRYRSVMDDAEIVALLSRIEPSEGEIPKPPFMAAIPAGPVIEAGADLDAVEAWVKARGGWTHRAPAHLADPDGERAPLFFIVPEGPPAAAARRAPALGARAAAAPGRAGGRAPGARVRRASAPPARGGVRAVTVRCGGLAGAARPHRVRGDDGPRRRARVLRAGARPAADGPEPDRLHVRRQRHDAAGRRRREADDRALHGARLDRRRHRGDGPRADGRGVDFERFDGVEQDELGIWSAPGGARSRGSRTPTATRCR